MNTEHALLLSSIDVPSLKGAKASPACLKADSQISQVVVYQNAGKYYVLEGADVVQALIELKKPICKVQITSKPEEKPVAKPAT